MLMKLRAFAVATSLAASLLTAGTATVFAETAVIVCPARNGSFAFTVDFDRKTVSSSSEGAPYTVPATITQQTISWDPRQPGGSHYPSRIDRFTGAFQRDLCTATGGCNGAENIGVCQKQEKKF
jgi:hypothetical protein